MKSKNILAGGILAAGVLFLSATGTHALTIIPPSTEFQVDPGKTYETKIKLFNETQNDLTLYTDVRNFIQQGETGTPSFDFTAERTGLASYVQVAPGPVAVGAGERAEVPVKIVFPADAEPGGAYAAIFFTETPPTPTAPGQVAISSKLGSLLLVRVSGDVVEMGNVAAFGTEVCNSDGINCVSGKKTYTHLPVSFFMRYTNTGNVHLRPSGTVTVKNLFGAETAKLPMNESDGATLPDSTRKYSTMWEKSNIAANEGNVWKDFWQEFGNEWKNFALGPYTVNLHVVAGSTSQLTENASLRLWVLPWRVLTLFALALAGLVVLIIFSIRRYNTYIIRRAQEQQGTSKKP